MGESLSSPIFGTFGPVVLGRSGLGGHVHFSWDPAPRMGNGEKGKF